MRCPICGHENKNDVVFCETCGSKIVNEQNYSSANQNGSKKKIFIIIGIIAAAAAVVLIAVLMLNGKKGNETAEKIDKIKADINALEKIDDEDIILAEELYETMSDSEKIEETATPTPTPTASPTPAAESKPKPTVTPEATPVPQAPANETYMAQDTGNTADPVLLRAVRADGVNVRSLPDHSSSLVAELPASADLYFYNEVSTGYGSDGQLHEWYKVDWFDSNYSSWRTGWVRGDLVSAPSSSSSDEWPVFLYPLRSDGVNARSMPDHSSCLVASLPAGTELMFFGNVDTGYGSDGELHEWYKVMWHKPNNGSTAWGWVRADLVG